MFLSDRSNRWLDESASAGCHPVLDGRESSSSGTDSERKIAAAKALVRATNNADGVQIIGPGRNETLMAPPGYVGSWAGVVKDCLDRIGRGEPPPSSVRDCARAVTLTFDAYRMAGEKPAGPQR